jgi:ribosomal protein S6
MPAVEAVEGTERELVAYELAFHVLPTIAEGEVTTVFENIKAAIATIGGELTSEEAPARFDLAFEISEFLEGRNRKFSSAYFGWVRFNLEPSKIAEVTDMVEGTKELLRHLLIRLTKIEEANQFYFHPAIADRVVETIIAPSEEEVAAPEVEVEEVVKIEEDGEEVKEVV